MKNFFLFLSSLPINRLQSLPAIIIYVALISVISWIYFSYLGLTLAYNDAMSHLNISRMVIDNQQPGLAQLGGVWLPLSHLLPLLLIWNDWAWHSGFAGSIFSMLAYVISFWALVKTTYLVTKNYAASVIAGLSFVLNLNMLYLQATPLTEPLYVCLFSLSTLCFTYLVTKKENKYLIFLGALGLLQVLTRYDGWFVVVMEGGLIVLFELFINRLRLQQILGKLFLFGLPILFGISSWLLWNYLIFHDPFFFAVGPYSAHAQQEAIKNSSGLFAKGNIFSSVLAYGYLMIHNVGTYVLLAASAGLIVLFSTIAKSLSLLKKILIVLFLLTPILFNILALFLGFSTVNVPELNWNPSGTPQAQWFNVRYGILALPAVAVFFGFFAAWKRITPILGIGIIFMQMYLMNLGGIVTILDGTKGSSAFDAGNISKAMEERIKPNEKVLMSTYSFNPVAFKSGIQLKQIVHEGLNKEWPLALKYPQAYAEWVVMANTPGDPLYSQLIENKNEAFLSHYKLVFTGNNSSIYHLEN